MNKPFRNFVLGWAMSAVVTLGTGGGWSISCFDSIQLLTAGSVRLDGQPASGIAHEINTPAQYVGDNVRFLKESIEGIYNLIDKQQELLEAKQQAQPTEALVTDVAAIVADIDLEYLLEEVPRALEQTLEGIGRITEIVRAMKEFSHPGAEGKVLTDVNRAIASTITVTRNEWKYVAEMKTDFDADLPMVPCLAGEFNQVILNIIINAAHAISQSVIVNKHGGSIDIETEMGVGTTFIIRLPIEPENEPKEEADE